jgi:hypothetical protein
VRDTVISLAPPNSGVLRTWTQEHAIPADDREAFVERAISVLTGLHEGNIGRYRIRPSEFSAWSEQHRSM